MRAACYDSEHGLVLDERPLPAIQEDELLLRVRAAAICGTDVKIIRHGHRRIGPGVRLVLGHEFVGEVVQAGSRTTGFRPGQRLGIAPNIGCGQCDCCVRGEASYCPEYQAFGITFDGGHAEYVRIPAAYLHAGNLVLLPETLADREAALLEPLSCVVAGIRACQLELGDTVVVYGAGPIGLLHLMLAARSGAAQVIAIDPQDQRLTLAREAGATLALNPRRDEIPAAVRQATQGRLAEAAIVACPVPEAQEQALQLLAPFGRLCLFGGLPSGSRPVHLDTNAIHYRRLLVTGTTGGSPQDYRIALRLAASGRIALAQIISDVFPWSRLAEAYRTAQNGALGKVVLLGPGLEDGR